ncbi:MAG: biopolymer transporter ExbD [Pigmentiphaga sp.]|nr:biopolymer transporter ExbD [Pigmentiphaga sp.]
MAFGSLNSQGQGSQTMSEINMVPLIDVMLVLLVIFMITAPLLSHSVVVELPKVSSQPVVDKPQTIDLAVDAGGQVYWNDQPVSLEAMRHQMRQVAIQKPQPSVNLRADRETRYEILAEILGSASRTGVNGIGFVTTPTPGGGGAPADGQAAEGVPAMEGASAPAPAAVP